LRTTNNGASDANKGAHTMFNTDLARRFAAIVCTVVMSATCIVGAVGPAQGQLGAGIDKVPAPIILTA
jgi:hypothetical protein